MSKITVTWLYVSTLPGVVTSTLSTGSPHYVCLHRVSFQQPLSHSFCFRARETLLCEETVPEDSKDITGVQVFCMFTHIPIISHRLLHTCIPIRLHNLGILHVCGCTQTYAFNVLFLPFIITSAQRIF